MGETPLRADNGQILFNDPIGIDLGLTVSSILSQCWYYSLGDVMSAS